MFKEKESERKIEFKKEIFISLPIWMVFLRKCGHRLHRISKIYNYKEEKKDMFSIKYTSNLFF